MVVFKDSRDGKIYETIQIGNQVWMAENLAYKPSYGNYWAYDNNNANVAVYGYLYNWETAKKVCPSGWHLPSDAEWTELTDFLGGDAISGGKLKETGAKYWSSPNTGATNETGFTALPGGHRGSSGAFYLVGIYGGWWSATEGRADIALGRSVNYNTSNLGRSNSDERSGWSVRCLRDLKENRAMGIISPWLL